MKMSSPAAFLPVYIGHLISSGFTLTTATTATSALVWDNREGRNHAINHSGSKMDAAKTELKSDIRRVKHKVDFMKEQYPVV